MTFQITAPILPPLLGPTDPPAVEFCHADGGTSVLLTCDHASLAVPASLGGLGLDPDTLSRHIGWDIGAAAVTRRLTRLLDAPAVLSGYSRLVIDCNRDPEDPTSIAGESDGVVVPGNRCLAPEDRARRRAQLFEPYHATIEEWVADRLARGEAPALLSIHSFTPVMNGFVRPWHVGVLWDRDPRIPVPLLAALRAEPDLCVGDNLPYSAHEPAGYTVRHHAVAHGLAHVAIELRQDLIADGAGAEHWAALLARVLAPILSQPQVCRRSCG